MLSESSVEWFSRFLLYRKRKCSSWRRAAYEFKREILPTRDAPASPPRWRRRRQHRPRWGGGQVWGQAVGARRCSRQRWRWVCCRTANLQLLLDPPNCDPQAFRAVRRCHCERQSTADVGEQWQRIQRRYLSAMVSCSLHIAVVCLWMRTSR